MVLYLNGRTSQACRDNIRASDAAAKAGESGGEVSSEGDIRSGVEVFSMTESGLALQATIAGTKYWKDNKLN